MESWVRVVRVRLFDGLEGLVERMATADFLIFQTGFKCLIYINDYYKLSIFTVGITLHHIFPIILSHTVIYVLYSPACQPSPHPPNTLH